MGVSYKKTKRIGKNTRLNVGKKSVGISTGVKGARVSVNSKRGVRFNLSIPGTGFRYSRKVKLGGGVVGAFFAMIFNFFYYIMKLMFVLIWWMMKIFFVGIYYMFYYTYIGIKNLVLYVKNKNDGNHEN